MKNWLNNYFGFTKKEFNGLLVLFAFIIFFSAFPYVYSLFESNTEVKIEELNAIQKLTLVPDDKYKNYSSSAYEEETIVHSERKLFSFDPNLIDMLQWQVLGLSEKQAKSILNYRNKGGKFRKAEDLKKMYAINDKTYQRLLPYVKIETEKTGFSNREDKFLQQNAVKPIAKIIEINTADTTQMDEIKGVGVAFARRIVKYRERLGGFYKKEQLMEVYGLDSLKYAEIKDQITVDVYKIKKININKVTFEELKNFPYLRYKQINAILAYRKNHGDFKSIEDLLQVKILSAQDFNNLSPYLIFN
ncbi:MAG: helix-hairpin-helix domain-containing protein [Sphingobacteriaceae bacterium]|nr:helix-hairpin-helix domain-containing protein [Sphingobacteriaceae bacterium]